IASGGWLLSSNPYLLLPVGVLLLTSFITMFLAIRAARPTVSNTKNLTKSDFINKKANILFFGHFISLSKSDYLSVMNTIVDDRTLTYEQTALHSYGLGLVLEKKFKLLQTAYSIFITGVATTIILFFIVYFVLHMTSVKVVGQQEETMLTEFKSLDTVMESSGVQQLLDGRFLTVSDELDHPFYLLTLDSQGIFNAKPFYPQEQFLKGSAEKDFRKLDDLEGIDQDNRGYIYATTSHSLSNKGERKKNREKLVRFKLEGEKIVTPIVINSLKEAIVKAHPWFEKAVKEKNGKSIKGFNIEGLSLNPTQDALFLGLRAPLKDNKAIVLRLENIDSLFNEGASPEISSQIHYLDLKGEAIRSLQYIPKLNGYFIISGPVGKSEGIEFNLWLWKPEKMTTQRVTVNGLKGFEEAEGITPIQWNGKAHLLIMTDGTLTGQEYSRYLILDYEQLQIAAP
ncbi:MAG: DUF3616 domain-containing protein, partial [Methylococcales bacterium]|nr:DUF3616 domain-containing protein [Methylococcales bacterium]